MSHLRCSTLFAAKTLQRSMTQTMPTATRRIVFDAIAISLQARLAQLSKAKPSRANQVRMALLKDFIHEVQCYHPDCVQ